MRMRSEREAEARKITAVHDVEAERGLLGALIIDPRRLGDVEGRLQPDDFYDPNHRKIFAAMLAIPDRATIDAITIQGRLSATGELDAAVAERLRGIEESALSVANLEPYADLVADKALRRRLATIGERIGELAVEASDTSQLCDSAEKLVFGVTDRGRKGEPRLMQDVLQETLKLVEKMRQSHSAVTGMATGIYKLDRWTTGFHPGELFILAARPGVGKTSLAMNMAIHAACHAEQKVAVAVFSLEMPCAQLALRMLCSEARISQGKLKSGKLSDYDMQLIMQHAASLWEAPVYIDDSGSLTIMELRSKARRLKQQNKELGFLVIDYLQLMSGGGKVESRQLEISEISRGLKSLSKELGLPVLALSQLSRDVEKNKRKPQLADLRECVTGDTLVLLADGGRVPIAELVGRTPEVLAVSDQGRIVRAVSDKVWKVGRRPVFRLRLASGRSIRCTDRHRLLGATGWKRVGELTLGDRLAIARSVPEPEAAPSWPEARLALLGQMIGDGSYLRGQPMRYTTALEENSQAVESAARDEFAATVKRYAGRGKWHQLLLSGNGNRWHPASVNAWLKDLGIFGQRSHEKRIPGAVFRLPNSQLAVLLRHLWATDGTISPAKSERSASGVHFATCSHGLAEDVAALLLRFGIVARIYKILQGPHRPVYMVVVSGTGDQERFLDRIGAFGPRVEPARRLRGLLETKAQNTNADTLPIETFGRVKALMKAEGVSHRRMAQLRGTSYGGAAHFRFAPSRATALEYAALLHDPVLAREATSDLFWDRLVEIEPAGEEEVYDLTVPGPASWLADGIVSHNSGAIEQDADCVLFIHKEPDAMPNGVGGPVDVELIIAKQRNGPTGGFPLVFMSEYTRFENAADTEGGGPPP